MVRYSFRLNSFTLAEETSFSSIKVSVRLSLVRHCNVRGTKREDLESGPLAKKSILCLFMTFLEVVWFETNRFASITKRAIHFAMRRLLPVGELGPIAGKGRSRYCIQERASTFQQVAQSRYRYRKTSSFELCCFKEHVFLELVILDPLHSFLFSARGDFGCSLGRVSSQGLGGPLWLNHAQELSSLKHISSLANSSTSEAKG